MSRSSFEAARLGASGQTHSSFSELETTQDVTIFGLADEELELLREDSPYVAEFSLPADTYDSIYEDIQTLAMWNVFIGHRYLPPVCLRGGRQVSTVWARSRQSMVGQSGKVRR